MERMSEQDVADADGLDGWRVLQRSLRSSFATGSLADGLAFAARIGPEADAANHHPDLTVTYPSVDVFLTTHDADGLTQLDIDLARTISAIAVEMGFEAEPSSMVETEIAIDTADAAAIRPFWWAVFGHEPTSDGDEVADPARRHPTIWFQASAEPRTQRNRIHLDVYVPADLARERVDAVLAAGGRLVADDRAPDWWVLADAEGNEACICTSVRGS